MGNVFSRKKATDPRDYEKALADLDEQVRSLDLGLIEKRSSERRVAILIVAYSSLLYLLILLYIFFYPWRHVHFSDQRHQQLIDASILLLFPLAVWVLRRTAGWAYRRRISGMEAALKKARSLQKAKLEELKNQTAYYQTKGLLERFDPDFSAKSKLVVHKTSPVPQEKKQLMGQSQQLPRPVSVSPTTIVQHVAVPTWFDRLMDSLIGDDRMSKYALICPRCHSHNGLVRPEELETVQYACPNCKLFIPAKNQSSSTLPSRNASDSTISTIGGDVSGSTEDSLLVEESSSPMPLPDFSTSPSLADVEEDSSLLRASPDAPSINITEDESSGSKKSKTLRKRK